MADKQRIQRIDQAFTKAAKTGRTTETQTVKTTTDMPTTLKVSPLFTGVKGTTALNQKFLDLLCKLEVQPQGTKQQAMVDREGGDRHFSAVLPETGEIMKLALFVVTAGQLTELE